MHFLKKKSKVFENFKMFESSVTNMSGEKIGACTQTMVGSIYLNNFRFTS